jgi:hypothetical protein
VGRALQQANLGKDVGGGQKDAILASAETTIKVNNGIDPATELGGEDGEYKTISESIDNIPENNTKRYVLHLKRGTVFREKALGNPNRILCGGTAEVVQLASVSAPRRACSLFQLYQLQRQSLIIQAR